jgi:hypothetical protein
VEAGRDYEPGGVASLEALRQESPCVGSGVDVAEAAYGGLEAGDGIFGRCASGGGRRPHESVDGHPLMAVVDGAVGHGRR